MSDLPVHRSPMCLIWVTNENHTNYCYKFQNRVKMQMLCKVRINILNKSFIVIEIYGPLLGDYIGPPN